MQIVGDLTLRHDVGLGMDFVTALCAMHGTGHPGGHEKLKEQRMHVIGELRRQCC